MAKTSDYPEIALTVHAGELGQRKAIEPRFQQHIFKQSDADVLVQMIVQLVQPLL